MEVSKELLKDYKTLEKEMCKLAEEYDNKAKQVIEDFNKKYSKALVSKDFKVYGNMEAQFDLAVFNLDFWVRMFEIVDSSMNLGECIECKCSDHFKDFKEVDMSLLKDNRVKVEGMTMEDFKKYFEINNIPTKSVIGSSLNYLSFDFELYQDGLILKLKRKRTKGECTKFNSTYHKIKLLKQNKKSISKIIVEDFFRKEREVSYLSYNSDKEYLSFISTDDKATDTIVTFNASGK